MAHDEENNLSSDDSISNDGAIENEKSESQHDLKFNLDSVENPELKKYIESLAKDNVKFKGESIKWRQRAGENQKIAEESKRVAEQKADSALKLIQKTQELSDKRIVEAEIRLISSELGLKKKEYIRLADMSNVKIEDDGTVFGVRESLSALKQADPDLFSYTKTTNLGYSKSENFGKDLEAPDLSDIKSMSDLIAISKKYFKN